MKKQQYKLVIISITTFFVGVIGTLYVSRDLLKNGNTIKTVKDVNITTTNSIKDSIEKIYDSVVLIETYDKKNKQLSSGTGFVYKKDSKKAYILTNHHVVEGSSVVRVTTTNADTIEAKFLGSDEYTDLAVLSIDEKYASKIAKIGNSSDSSLGDVVFTVGSPLGVKYMGTVTKGILSGKDRQVTVNLTNGDYIMDVLQTDAAINPGNSGGPLVNINGEVIAITSMKLVQDEIEGMGFGLPIEIAMSYVDRLENGQTIERPLLGVQVLDLQNSDYIYRRYGISISDKIEYGVVILAVEDLGSAKKAGLEKGDVITKINDNNIQDNAHFRYNLYKYSIGDTITITFIRGNKEYNVSVKLTDSLGKN